MSAATRLRLLAVVSGVLLALAPSAFASSWSVTLASVTRQGQATGQAAPSAPSTVTATCTSSATSSTSNAVTVSWTAVTHATEYIVSKSTSSSGSFTSAGTATGTSTTITGLSAGTSYWKVTAEIGTNWVSALSAASAARTITSSNGKYTCR